MTKKRSSMVWGKVGVAALAGVVGGALGVLLAPRSGKQTRIRLAKQGKKVTKSVKGLAETAGEVMPKASKMLAKAKSKAKRLS